MKYKKEEIEYQVIKHHRAKNITLSIHADGRIVVTVPRYTAKREAHKLVADRLEWIRMQEQRVLEKRAARPNRFPEDSTKVRKVARTVITKRLGELNAMHFGFQYNRVSIRAMRTRWGSCSSENNFSFSYTVAYLPDELRDYVLIHELAHLKHMNHSQGFWSLVGSADPEYAAHRKELLQYQQ